MSGPNDISPDPATVGNAPGATATEDLDFFDNVGTDKDGTAGNKDDVNADEDDLVKIRLQGMTPAGFPGTLTLRGRVPSCYMKQVAGTAVATLEGIALIANQLDIIESSD